MKLNSKLLLVSLFSAVTLAACGGGGDASPPAAAGQVAEAPPAPAAPAPSVSSGSVTAPFAGGVPANFFVTGVGTQRSGELESHVQMPDGAITSINQMKLVGAQVVRDISGDQTFAMGRWAAGTAQGVYFAGDAGLSESSNAAYHYVMLAQADSFPASGTLTCSDASFTAPSWTGSTPVPPTAYLGETTGTATLSFSPEGAGVSVALSTQAGGSTGSRVFNAIVLDPSRRTISGNSLGLPNSVNAFLIVGRAPDGAYAVGGIYSMLLSNDAMYVGAFRFVCK